MIICITSKVGLVNDRLTDGWIASRIPSALTLGISKKPSQSLGKYSLDGADLVSSMNLI